MLIDSHCHLHDREFYTEAEAENCLERARNQGIEKIICIGTNHKDSLAARDFAARNDNVYWTYGIHPENASIPWDFDVKEIFADNKARPVAIGEVGLDYHYDGYDREAEIRLFERMLQLATDYKLPLSFHVREAFDDFFSVVKNFPMVRGVVHSFTDSKKTLRRILTETDFMVGVNGLATYSTLPMPPLGRILLETDAPFLAPVPHRGEKNEPAHIRDIAVWLAEKLEMDFAEIAEITTRNTEKLFGI